MSIWASFRYGLGLPFQALRLILSRPKLLLWSLAPIAITLGLYIGVFVSIQGPLSAWITGLLFWLKLTQIPWLGSVVQVLIDLGILWICAITFSAMAALLSTPFSDFLAEASESWCQPPLPPAPRTGCFGWIRLIGIDLGKALFTVPFLVLSMVSAWLPGVNFAVPVMTSLLIVFQFISYPQTRRGLGIGDGVRFLFQHFCACMGLGLMLFGLFSVPFLSALAIPLAVVSGTLLVGRAPGDLKDPNLPALR